MPVPNPYQPPQLGVPNPYQAPLAAGLSWRDAGDRLVLPAILLMMGAGLNAAMAGFLLLGLAINVADQQKTMTGPDVGVAIWVGITLCSACATFYGANRMRRADSYGWALAAAVIASTPLLLPCLLQVPVAIWALVILSRRQVRAAMP